MNPHESVMGIHVFPHSEPHFHPHPTPIPLGFPRALALGALPHESNLHWSSMLHMVIYMFQCYSLKSSHPLLVLQSPSLFFTSVSLAALYVGMSLPSF